MERGFHVTSWRSTADARMIASGKRQIRRAAKVSMSGFVIPLTGDEGDHASRFAAELRSLYQLGQFRRSGTGSSDSKLPLICWPERASLRVTSEGQEA
jgi:hypothetical protein